MSSNSDRPCMTSPILLEQLNYALMSRNTDLWYRLLDGRPLQVHSEVASRFLKYAIRNEIEILQAVLENKPLIESDNGEMLCSLVTYCPLEHVKLVMEHDVQKACRIAMITDYALTNCCDEVSQYLEGLGCSADYDALHKYDVRWMVRSNARHCELAVAKGYAFRQKDFREAIGEYVEDGNGIGVVLRAYPQFTQEFDPYLEPTVIKAFIEHGDPGIMQQKLAELSEDDVATLMRCCGVAPRKSARRV
jgi:hypothetical protein